jgi:hypothetical protein
MNYALILVPILTLLLGGTLGYCLGRYQSRLIDKIRTLEAGNKPKPEPAVTLGAYDTPKEYAPVDNSKPVGLVDPKTPQRIQWEAEQAIEKEGRGL